MHAVVNIGKKICLVTSIFAQHYVMIVGILFIEQYSYFLEKHIVLLINVFVILFQKNKFIIPH